MQTQTDRLKVEIAKEKKMLQTSLMKYSGGRIISKENLDLIAIKCDISSATVYNYIGGKISNIHIAKAILNSIQETLTENPIK